MIFTSYFDEADSHGPSPTLIMAGYVGHSFQWRRFDKKLARLQKRDGFTIFHAKDFKSRHGEFSGWSEDKCDKLVADLTMVVRKCLTQGMTTALTRERYLNEYRAPPIPKKMHLDSQYGACFRVCVAQLIHLMEQRGNHDRVHVVIEDGHPNVTDCLRIFKDIKSRFHRLGIDVLGNITLAKKKDCPPLMVADFLAAAHSMLRAGVAAGTLDRSKYTIPPDSTRSTKDAIAILDLAPDSLKALKRGFEYERQKDIDEWRARRAERKKSPAAGR